SLHIAEEKRIVRRLLTFEKAACVVGVEIASPRENGGRHRGHVESVRELRLSARRAVGEGPGAVVHVQPRYGEGRTESVEASGVSSELVQIFDASSTVEASRFARPRVGGGLGWSRKRVA